MPSNHARINIDLVQSTQYQALISSDLTPKIRSVYQITVNLKAGYSSVRASDSARLIGQFLSITVGRELTGQDSKGVPRMGQTPPLC